MRCVTKDTLGTVTMWGGSWGRGDSLLYHRRDVMDLKRFGCRIDPFAEVHDREFLYWDAQRRRISEEIIGSIGRTAGFIVLAGEAGAGRTAMLHGLSEAIKARPDCYILSPVPWVTCRQGTSLRELAEAFSYARWVARLRDGGSDTRFGAFLAAGHRAELPRGRRRGPGGELTTAVVILDDAHRLAPQVVVQLRRWRTAYQSARGPLSIILTSRSEEGSADAGAMAAGRKSADSGDVLMQLRPFERTDVEHLIHHRLRAAGSVGATPFSPEAVRRIFVHAKGNPSRTTRLCRRALALASEKGRDVSIAMIDAAAEMEFRPQPSAAIDVPFSLTSAAPSAPRGDVPPAQDVSEAARVGAEAPGAPIVVGERPALRARALRLALATTSMVTVVAVGWFYAAGRDIVMHPVAAFETTVSAGMEPAPAPPVAAAGAEIPQPANAESNVFVRDQTDHAPQPQAAPMDIQQQAAETGAQQQQAEHIDAQQQAAETGTQQQAAETVPKPPAANPEPLELEAQTAPSAPDLTPLAFEPLEPEAKEAAEMPVRQAPSSGVAGPEVDDLLDRGSRLLELGDVAAARLFYVVASERGSAEGAMLMGLTFDPVFFERKGIYGTRPHVFEAMEWYRKSASMGNVVAEEHISALLLWLRRAAHEGDDDARYALKLLEVSP